MNLGKSIIHYLIYIALGTLLLVLGYQGVVDDFWYGIDVSLMVVGVLRLLLLYRFHKDEAYREKFETEVSDERNRFLRNKAWAWAGYLFILIAGSAVIVLKVLHQDLLSLAASYAVCLMLVLYWGAYWLLRKKY
jgi:uncharacterized membrane protein